MKGYSCKPYEDSDYSEFVVADTSKEALKIARNESDLFSEGDAEFTEARVKWCRKTDVTGLKKGLQDDYVEVLKRHGYGYVEECECPICHSDNTLYVQDCKDGDFVGCADCNEKHSDESLSDIPKEAHCYKSDENGD